MPITEAEPPAVELRELIGLFYDSDESLGQFTAIDARGTIPEPFQGLLRHERHMTVTVEAFHDCSVDVRVARTKYGDPDWYAREITLHRHTDGLPVQYGIVRINTELLAPEVWQEIRGEQIPLGRVLINHGVLREVELCELWRVIAGRPLANLLEIPPGTTVYGRTARIFCDYLPAIELLEIVTTN